MHDIYSVKNNRVLVPVVLCAVILCLFFRLKELFQVKNGLTTLLHFFFFLFDNPKNLGRSDDAKRREKRGWPN